MLLSRFVFHSATPFVVGFHLTVISERAARLALEVIEWWYYILLRVEEL